MLIGQFTIRMIPSGDQRTLYIDCDTGEISATADICIADIADALRQAGEMPERLSRLDQMFGEEAA